MSRNLYFEDEMMERKFSFAMLRNILSYAKKYKKTYAMVLGFLILTSVLSMIPAFLNMQIINRVLPKDGVLLPNFRISAIIIVSIWSAVIIGQVVATYINNRVTLRLGNGIVCELRKDMFDKLMQLSFDYYDSRPSGKILVRITSYCDEISQIFVDHLTNIIMNLFNLVFALVFVCFTEIRLMGWVLLVELPMLIIVFILIEPKLRKSTQ